MNEFDRELIVPARLDAWAEKNARIARLQGSCYGEYLLAAFRELQVSILYKSGIHGLGHIERTMLLGAMIAQAQALSEHETRMLLFACSYHDVGRSHDRRDDSHGAASAEKMLESPLREQLAQFDEADREIIRAAVTAHAISDWRMSETARLYGLEGEALDRYLRVTRCLKDADNLDRVRLGDLDVGHLRHEESVRMESDANYILREYGGL